MQSLTLTLLALFTIMSLTNGAPEPHHQNDPYTPVINFLKQLRKARKHGGSIIGNREGEEGTPINQGGQQGFPQLSQSPSAQQPVSILYPSDSSAPSSNSGSGSSSNGNDQRITIQLPSNFPAITPRPPSSPADIQRVNSGVSTILSGVRTFDLGQILRGAFIFPQNDNVKSVANTVIDSIFGAGGGKTPEN